MKRKLWSIRYYFRRLFGMDWKTFFKTVKTVQERSQRSWLVSFLDIIWSSFAYSAGYNDYIEFEFHLLNHKQRKTFITAPQSMKVAKAYNDPNSIDIMLDKSKFHKSYKDFIQRDYLDLRECTVEDLKNFIEKHKQVMFKVIDGNSGVGITRFDLKEQPQPNYQKLYEKGLKHKQVLVEEYFKQHDSLTKLSPTSVNTIRMITFIDNEKQPHLLSAALKIGIGSYLDNIGQGGAYTILSDDGEVVVPFINQQGDHIEVHPITKANLMGFKVPNFESIKETLFKACMVEPSIRYVGWDIAITKEGALEIMEGNPFSGPFQLSASLAKNKIGQKPTYQKVMDIQL